MYSLSYANQISEYAMSRHVSSSPSSLNNDAVRKPLCGKLDEIVAAFECGQRM